jgi:hypothetical protein
MLFDLRSAGRRRTVKLIYFGLAIVMFVGFVGFSIGSSGLGGGLLDIFSNGGGGSSSSGTSRFEQQVTSAQARTRTQPEDPAAWAALALAKVRLAGVGDNFDVGANNYTDKGLQQLRGAATAWNKYLALNPKNPDPRLARQMVQAFVSLKQAAGAAGAQEIVTGDDPTSNTFFQLAVYAYAAGETRKGDLAAAKAISLAPKTDRKALKTSLAQAKAQSPAATATATPTPTATPKAKKDKKKGG